MFKRAASSSSMHNYGRLMDFVRPLKKQGVTRPNALAEVLGILSEAVAECQGICLVLTKSRVRFPKRKCRPAMKPELDQPLLSSIVRVLLVLIRNTDDEPENDACHQRNGMLRHEMC